MIHRFALLWLCWTAIAPPARGGGTGLNVMVVVNQTSTNSVQLGNYYAEKRAVPPQNFLRINWPGGNADWTRADFTNFLLNPLLGAVAARQLSQQVDFVVLSMDIPFRIAQGGAVGSSGTNSTTSALFYGFKPDASIAGAPLSCSLPANSANSYAGTEAILRYRPPSTAPTNSFLAVMITGSNLAQAMRVVDQGVASDFTSPTTPIVLGNNQNDPFRSIRYKAFDNAVFNTRVLGKGNVIRDNSFQPYGLGILSGYENGMYTFSAALDNFAAGAMADSLTSYSGIIFPPSAYWTTILELIGGGATGSYGTVVEPCQYVEKFPSPQNFFYQTRGFTLAECYYQSVTNCHEGLIVGEPLAAPFATPPGVGWLGLPTGAVLKGTTNLACLATAGRAGTPVHQVNLFVDGTYAKTVTNITPAVGNVLAVGINGFWTNHTVPAGASLQSVASNLVVRLNGSSYTNQTKVKAFQHGDRIELQALGFTKPGGQISLSVSNAAGAASAPMTFVSASGPSLLDTVATGVRYGYSISNLPQAGDYLRCVVVKTNGQTVLVSVTNNTATATLAQFVKEFVKAVNTNVDLQGFAGVSIENVNYHEDWAAYGMYPSTDHSCEFNVRALGPGWAAAKVQVAFSGSSRFTISPAGTNRLDTNPVDLVPRAHLYVTAGLTNLAANPQFASTNYADGWHELSAVAYEGSHVHTMSWASQWIQISNSPLAATFTTLYGGSVTDAKATLSFMVVANTNAISKIELFSTGGSAAVVQNQPAATFAVPGTNLGPGLHPFYAVVTTSFGRQYRTETKWIRLIGLEPAFQLGINAAGPTLFWPATAGRNYEIQSRSAASDAFAAVATLTPSNSHGRWSDPDGRGVQRFYRVRANY